MLILSRNRNTERGAGSTSSSLFHARAIPGTPGPGSGIAWLHAGTHQETGWSFLARRGWEVARDDGTGHGAHQRGHGGRRPCARLSLAASPARPAPAAGGGQVSAGDAAHVAVLGAPVYPHVPALVPRNRPGHSPDGRIARLGAGDQR